MNFSRVTAAIALIALSLIMNITPVFANECRVEKILEQSFNTCVCTVIKDNQRITVGEVNKGNCSSSCKSAAC